MWFTTKTKHSVHENPGVLDTKTKVHGFVNLGEGGGFVPGSGIDLGGEIDIPPVLVETKQSYLV